MLLFGLWGLAIWSLFTVILNLIGGGIQLTELADKKSTKVTPAGCARTIIAIIVFSWFAFIAIYGIIQLS